MALQTRKSAPHTVRALHHYWNKCDEYLVGNECHALRERSCIYSWKTEHATPVPGTKRIHILRFQLSHLLIMAPSITETTPLRDTSFSVPLKTDSGYNKENIIGYRYETEAESKGTIKQPPASFPHYLPVWDNETERYEAHQEDMVIKAQ